MRAELERRPLIFLFASLVIGVTASFYIWNLIFFPILFFVASSLSRRIWLTAGLLFGVLLMPERGVLKEGGFVQADAVMTSRPRLSQSGWISQAKVGGVPLLLVGSGAAPSEGETLEISGTVRPSRIPEELAGSLTVDHYRIVQDPSWLFQLAEHWRDSVKSFVQECKLGQEDQDLLLGICFGTDELSPGEFQDAARGGWLRILSASGIQVIGLAWILEAVFRLVPVPRLAGVGLLTLALILYALATGHHASTERAIFIVLLSRWAFLFRREPDILSSLALTGTLMLFLDPWQVYSSGFHLTLLVVAGFALFSRRISASKKSLAVRIRLGGEGLLRGILIGCLASIPIVAQAFHEVSFAGVLATALLMTVVPAILVMTFGLHAVWSFWPSAGLGLQRVLVEPLISGMHSILETQSGLTISFPVPAFSGYLLLVYYGAWLLTWGKRARPA